MQKCENSEFIKYKNNKSAVLQKIVEPNIIHNRFDILYGDEYELYNVGGIVVPVKEIDNHLNVGLYLVSGDKELFTKFINYLLEIHPRAKYVEVKHCYINLCGAEPYPYWHIVLPDTIEKFNKILSSRTRYNTKWYPKKVKENIGEYVITKYSADEIPDVAMELYFKWKEKSHGFVWKYSNIDYIRYSGITHGYVMAIDKKIYAIGFICDTGDNVYFENFSYDEDYRKFSLGMIIYYYIICDMIKSRKRIMWLSGGWLEYKKRYGGTLTYTFSGKIYKKFKIMDFLYKIKFWDK